MFDENKEPIVAELRKVGEQMQQHGKQIAVELSNIVQRGLDEQLRQANAIMQDTIISSVKAIVKEEVHLAMRDQQHVLPDR